MKTRAIAATGLLVLGCVAVPASGATASARNCYVKGDLICAPTSAAQQYRAWQTFDPRVFTKAELSKPFKVTYRGTTLAWSGLADGHDWYTTPTRTKGIENVFEIEFGVSR